jgi:hypothetical protein
VLAVLRFFFKLPYLPLIHVHHFNLTPIFILNGSTSSDPHCCYPVFALVANFVTRQTYKSVKRFRHLFNTFSLSYAVATVVAAIYNEGNLELPQGGAEEDKKGATWGSDNYLFLLWAWALGPDFNTTIGISCFLPRLCRI